MTIQVLSRWRTPEANDLRPIVMRKS